MFTEHKEALEVAEQPANTLKLSEAIRIGARIRPQCRGSFFREGGSCALGAAYEAITGRVLPEYADATSLHGVVPHMRDHNFRFSIVRKNDGDRWTRERIADWLEAQGF
jgi:hypothetical protein